LVLVALAACGGSPPAQNAAPATSTTPTGPSAAELQAQHDREQKTQLEDAHHKLEAEQQDALAVTCDQVGTPSHDRCLPSCYPTEGPDSRATRKLSGATEIEHFVCETADGEIVGADELAKGLHARAYRQRFPRLHKKGTWQEAIETALKERLPPGDVAIVTGQRRDVVHPLTHEKMTCTIVARYARKAKHPIDRCGSVGDVTCEADGNPTARAINVAHYRLQEAKRLQTMNNLSDCQQAALEAIAVSRGLPRWRQYEKLNVQKWPENLRYRTRFDGTLDEDMLFATIAKLGEQAQELFASCGGGVATTSAEQEQSFHACW
jgi:hypothetical protein